jgi:outer membrane protein
MTHQKIQLLLLALSILPATGMAQQMTIDDLFSKVKDNSNDMKASRTAVDVAAKDIEIAKSQKLPDIDTQLSFSYNGNGFLTDRDFSHFTSTYIPHFGNNFAIEASQAVYTGGALSSGIRMAEIGKQQAETGLAITVQQLCFIALGQYLELYKIDNQIKVYDKNIALTERLIENVKAKYSQGTALKNDITRYELQMDDQRLQRVKLTNQRAILNHQLCTTIGAKDMTIMPDTTIINKVYEKDGEQSWQNAASTSSPLLRQTALSIDLAHQQTILAKSEQKPKISLMAADYLNGPITIEVPPINKNLNYWYIGIGLKYNISSLFKSGNKVKRAQISERRNTEEHNAMADRINNNVQQAYTLYLQSYEELSTEQKSVALAIQNYDVINNRYLNQLALVTDMVDAENTKLSTELQEVNARIGVVYAYYKMKYVSGTL